MTHHNLTPPAGAAPQIARPHRANIECNRATILGRVADEWVRITELPDTPDTLRVWAKQEPVLSGVTSLPQILDAIDATLGIEERDQLLAALLRIHQAGDAVAGHLLLMQMLPKLVKLARSVRSLRDLPPEDAYGECIAAYWQVLGSEDISTKRNLVATLALNTLKHVSGGDRSSCYTEREISLATENVELIQTVRDQQPLDDPTLSAATRTDAPDPSADLATLLSWALEHHVLDEASTQLLARVYAPLPGQPGGAKAVAVEMGIEAAAVRTRCARATRKIVAAITALADGEPYISRPVGTPTAVG